MNNIQFAKNLVKGKIAETVFAQMLRETKTFTVLEFGYEKVIPQLVQQGYDQDEATLEIIRTAPDFAVIDQTTKEVRLVEVKYMRTLSKMYALRDAKRMGESWNPSYLFIATLDGFYFDKIDKIIENNGEMTKLEHSQIPQSLQDEYVKILINFEGKN